MKKKDWTPLPANELPIDENIARGLPGGKVDLSTFEEIETALDQAEAPIKEGRRWLTLSERVAALDREKRIKQAALKWQLEDGAAELNTLVLELRTGGYTNAALLADRLEAIAKRNLSAHAAATE